MGGDAGRDRRVRRPVDVVDRQRVCLHRSAARLRVGLRGQPARAGNPHHQLHPVSPADLRQDRTVLADVEEVAARPPAAGHHRRAQRPARAVPRFLQPPPTAPRATRSHPGRGVRRHREGPPRRPAATCTGLRQPPHRRRRQSGNLFVAPYQVNVGLRWAGHDATSSATATTSPSSAAPPWSANFTADPTRNYQPGDKTTRTYRTREPKPHIMGVSDVSRHMCQRCQTHAQRPARRNHHSEAAVDPQIRVHPLRGAPLLERAEALQRLG